MTTYTQDNSFIAVDTPLGKDKLLLMSFSGSEAISRLFSFELGMISLDHNIPFDGIIGKSATVSIILADGSKCYFNGMISRFSEGTREAAGGEAHRFAHYTATMVPQLWLLTRTADVRIFQNKAVNKIVEQILTDNGISDFEMHLTKTYKKRDYCVQYRETDFNFISRLLEEEGIYYFFRHEEKKHTLVLMDKYKPDVHVLCPKQETAKVDVTVTGWVEEDVITSIEKIQEIQVGEYALNDFNFETPNTSLKAQTPSSVQLGPGKREVYDYPGIYTKYSEGDELVKVRMEEEEARITIIPGASVCRAFRTGFRFKLSGHRRTDMNNKEFLLTSISHGASESAYFSGSEQSQFYYTNTFSCIPKEVQYRPHRLTPKPLVYGTQTAIVVGPSGQEIFTDKYGRIKVQFHWDREGKKNENSSCWIRVGQLWAGSGWGGLYIPRIKQEVIVDFLEGDPDRPIVIGCVYHGTNMPPYPLPDEKTKSTIKSDSSLGGGGFNEIRLEDKKGSEEIYVHGQKDWTIVIEHDKNQQVLNCETLFVAVNRDKTVGSNQTEAIGVNKTITVGANHTETIGANMTQTIALNEAETVGIAKALTIGAAYQVSVGAAMNETIGAVKAEEIGASKTVSVGVDSSEEVGSNKSVSAGKDVSVEAGKNMTLTAGDQIVLKCGSASITMKKNGDITIKGKTINIKGSGNVVVKGQKILEN